MRKITCTGKGHYGNVCLIRAHPVVRRRDGRGGVTANKGYIIYYRGGATRNVGATMVRYSSRFGTHYVCVLEDRGEPPCRSSCAMNFLQFVAESVLDQPAKLTPFGRIGWEEDQSGGRQMFADEKILVSKLFVVLYHFVGCLLHLYEHSYLSRSIWEVHTTRSRREIILRPFCTTWQVSLKKDIVGV